VGNLATIRAHVVLSTVVNWARRLGDGSFRCVDLPARSAMKEVTPMRNWLWLSCIGLLVVTSAAPAQPDAKLDGEWTAVAAERDGKPAPDVVGHKLGFHAGTFRITRDGKTLYAGTYSTDSAKQPAQIDFVNRESSLRGTWKGIVQLDGATLKICDNAPDMTKPRPTAFAAPAGSGYVSIEFRRDKP
jgi:uncharacterized protein (TIGR03067 family)